MNDGYLTGVFYSRDDAERAIDALHELGYRDDDVSVLMTDQTRARQFEIHSGNKSAAGATTGGIVGGALGAIVAGMTTAIAGVVLTGGVALPLVAGPIAAILAGLGAGGVTGGVIGALVGAGIPEKRAHEIESELQRGGIVVGLTPDDEDRAAVEEILAGTRSQPRTETGEIEPDIAPRRVIP